MHVTGLQSFQMNRQPPYQLKTLELSAGARTPGVRTEVSARSVGEVIALAAVYAVSVASLAGFATFSLHPELLTRAEVSPETYGRILVLAPRAQILIALGALAAFLSGRTGRRWVPAFAVAYAVALAAELAGTT